MKTYDSLMRMLRTPYSTSLLPARADVASRLMDYVWSDVIKPARLAAELLPLDFDTVKRESMQNGLIRLARHMGFDDESIEKWLDGGSRLRGWTFARVNEEVLIANQPPFIAAFILVTQWEAERETGIKENHEIRLAEAREKSEALERKRLESRTHNSIQVARETRDRYVKKLNRNRNQIAELQAENREFIEMINGAKRQLLASQLLCKETGIEWREESSANQLPLKTRFRNDKNDSIL